MGKNGTAYYGLPELKPSTEDELRAEYEPARLGMFTALLGMILTSSSNLAAHFERMRRMKEQVARNREPNPQPPSPPAPPGR